MVVPTGVGRWKRTPGFAAVSLEISAWVKPEGMFILGSFLYETGSGRNGVGTDFKVFFVETGSGSALGGFAVSSVGGVTGKRRTMYFVIESAWACVITFKSTASCKNAGEALISG